MKLLKTLVIIISIFFVSCSHQGKQTLHKKLELNPKLTFATLIDPNIPKHLNAKIKKDLEKFNQVSVMNPTKVEALLSRAGINLDDIKNKGEIKKIYDLAAFHFLAFFYYENKRVMYKAYNLITKIYEEFDITDFLKFPEENWLLFSQSGWIYISSTEPLLDVFFDYNLKGYTPLLTCLEHNEYQVTLTKNGVVIHRAQVKIPLVTKVTAKVTKEQMKKLQTTDIEDLEMGPKERNQAIFISIITVLSIVAGIVIPLAL